jgi:DNA polymerase kappa
VLLQKLEHIASELESDMSRNGWAGKTVTLKYKLDTYQGEIPSQSLVTELELIVRYLVSVFTRARSLDRYVSSKEDLFSVRVYLLDEVLVFNNSIPDREDFISSRRASEIAIDRLKSDEIERFTCFVIRRHQEGEWSAPSLTLITIYVLYKFFETTSASPCKRAKLENEELQELGHGSDDLDDQHMDAMPGFYEHEETMQDIEPEDISRDDEVEVLKPVQDQSKITPRPPVSAPPRPSSSTMLPHIPQNNSLLKKGPVKRERSRSDVGSRPSVSQNPDHVALVCPICDQTLKVDNQDLNTHIDLCLSRNAIEEAIDTRRVAGTSKNGTNTSSTPTTKDWGFLMGPKDTPPRSKRQKRR